MKSTVKDLFISILASIGMAMTIFCLAGIVFDIGFGGHFSLENYTFTKMVAGSALVGLGYGVPTIIYRKESLPLPIKIIIHMGIGTAIYLGVAYAVGWIGGSDRRDPARSGIRDLVCIQQLLPRPGKEDEREDPGNEEMIRDFRSRILP